MFYKVATVTTTGVFESEGSGLKRTASSPQGPRGYYTDGAAALDVKARLKAVAEKYDISPDPKDYLFEAIRANTVNVPNENHDAFHKNELLRFDTRLGMPVYRTYVGKPHHLNHRADDPLQSRGLIIDAHFNDSSAPLDECPNCGSLTKEASARTPDGIHCAGCGTTVKDEFVEILLGIDTTKDPVLAKGIREGVLKSGSMGCNCASTTCNVCEHVATSRPEFCEHIRGASKGTWWERGNHGWRKISTASAKRTAMAYGVKFDPSDLCYLQRGNHFQIRKAFEYCNGVEYDEYSRVDVPADPKANTREILGKEASAAVVMTREQLQQESEQLLARALRRQGSEERDKVASKQAMAYHVVRVDGNDANTFAGETLDDAMQAAGAQPGAQLEYDVVEAPDPQTARLQGQNWQPVMGREGDVVVNITEDPDLDSDPMVDVENEQPPMGPETMEDFTEEELSPEAPGLMEEEELSPEEMGIMPPGASADPEEQNMKYESAYQDWTVQVSPKGNARIVSPSGPVMLVRAAAKPTSDQDRIAFGQELVTHLKTYGLVRTAQRYETQFDSKFAQVVDHALDDMRDFADKYTKSNVAGGGDNDMLNVQRGDRPGDVRDNGEDDMTESRDAPPTDVREQHMPDHEHPGGAPDSSVADQPSDMRGNPRAPFSMSDSSLDNEVHDHKERLAALEGSYVVDRQAKTANAWLVDSVGDDYAVLASEGTTREVPNDTLLDRWMQLDKAPTTDIDQRVAKLEERLKALYSRREAELQEAHAEELAAAERVAIERHARAIRVVAQRHSLNMELSPLKESFGVVLANSRTVGHDSFSGAPLSWEPISDQLTAHLIEAAWKQGGKDEIETILERAAEIVHYDAEILSQSEADLGKQAHVIPQVTSVTQVDDVLREAEETRREILAGNMELQSHGVRESAEGPAPQDTQRMSIRAALSSK